MCYVPSVGKFLPATTQKKALPKFGDNLLQEVPFIPIQIHLTEDSSAYRISESLSFHPEPKLYCLDIR